MNAPKISTGEGSARYVFASLDEPADFLVKAVPGALEAREAWHAANAEGARLVAERTAASLRLRDIRAKFAPVAEVEEAEAAVRAAEAAVRANTGRAMSALRTFDTLVRDARTSNHDTHRLAAETALAAHKRVVEAWRVIGEAVPERERAWKLAGSPGRSWHRRRGYTTGDLARGRMVFESVVSDFDVSATAHVALGEPHDHDYPDLGGYTPEQAASAAQAQSHADNYSAQRVSR